MTPIEVLTRWQGLKLASRHLIRSEPLPAAILFAEDDDVPVMAHFYRTERNDLIRIRTVNRLASHEVDGLYSRHEASNLYNRLVVHGFSERKPK